MLKKKTEKLNKVVIRFAGDSGDGMQFTGSQFAETSAIIGNDIATFPDYPAEIRAPQGTVPGVSSFQVQIGHIDIHTPGDQSDMLVAMNPAALKANLGWLKPSGNILVDVDNFTSKNLEKAGFEDNPLESGLLEDYNVIKAPITSLTKESVSNLGLDNKTAQRCKNMFALGVVYWLFHRPLGQTEKFLEDKFRKRSVLAEANKRALEAGYSYAESIEALASSYIVPIASISGGRYRNISGNKAVAWGFLAAAEKAGRDLYLASYPITPASDILHELAQRKELGVKIFQGEDEIASVTSAIGASFAGDIGVTTTSGPGLALKSEAIGLAVMAELPLVIVDVQRGGPSTGLPTKTEQSDLLQALYGRNGESPVVVLAASTPGNCFDLAYKAVKIAIEHMTPVILLTDGYIANGAQPWKVPSVRDLAPIHIPRGPLNGKEWKPYRRDKESLVRDWIFPGTPGFEHRLGGLEKDAYTGDVSYDPENHEEMVQTREDKVGYVARFLPEQRILGPKKGKLLLTGWGGTFGILVSAQRQLKEEGIEVSVAQFHYIKPLPKNTREVLESFDRILVCELNQGQFCRYLQGEFPKFNYSRFNKVRGLPLMVSEVKDEVKKTLKK